MERRSHLRGLQFWREAPRLGLTGVGEIEIGRLGVISEHVTYDLNLASDMLRHPALLPGFEMSARGAVPT
jgi:hypothetical protein